MAKRQHRSIVALVIASGIVGSTTLGAGAHMTGSLSPFEWMKSVLGLSQPETTHTAAQAEDEGFWCNWFSIGCARNDVAVTPTPVVIPGFRPEGQGPETLPLPTSMPETLPPPTTVVTTEPPMPIPSFATSTTTKPVITPSVSAPLPWNKPPTYYQPTLEDLAQSDVCNDPNVTWAVCPGKTSEVMLTNNNPLEMPVGLKPVPSIDEQQRAYLEQQYLSWLYKQQGITPPGTAVTSVPPPVFASNPTSPTSIYNSPSYIPTSYVPTVPTLSWPTGTTYVPPVATPPVVVTPSVVTTPSSSAGTSYYSAPIITTPSSAAGTFYYSSPVVTYPSSPSGTSYYSAPVVTYPSSTTGGATMTIITTAVPSGPTNGSMPPVLLSLMSNPVRACTQNSACPAGQKCFDLVCVPGQCGNNYIDGNQCGAGACVRDAHFATACVQRCGMGQPSCPSGQLCSLEGFCINGGTQQCGMGQPCSASAPYCVAEVTLGSNTVNTRCMAGQSNVYHSAAPVDECHDSRDNNADGVTDTEDPSCLGTGTTEGALGFGLSQCNDGVDNNTDTVVDAEDPSCQSGPRLEGRLGRGVHQCNDTRDNDNNGMVDSDDPSCINGSHIE